MKVHQTLEWLNLLSLGTKGLKPHQQSVYNQNQLQMTTHYCAILTLSHQGAGCNCILSVSRRCVWCAARQGKESRLLLVAFPSPSPIGGERSDVSTLYSYVVWRHAGTAAGHTHTTHRHTSIAVTAGTAGTLVSKWRSIVLWFAAADCIPIVGSAKSLVLNDKRFNHTKVWCTFIFINLQAR